MGFLSTFLGVFGFGFGLPIGLLLGFFLFVYSHPKDVKDPVVRPLHELDSSTLQEILPEIPFWVKCPDYERVDWLNKFLLDMWPYLDKAICATIKSTTEPIFAEYIGKYKIEAIEFEHLTLGTLPPTIHGVKVYETNEKDLVMEPAISTTDSIETSTAYLSMFCKHCGVLDGEAACRFWTKNSGRGCNVNTWPLPICSGAALEIIKKKVASLYLWPQSLEIPILDASTVAVKKPVGILHVKVVRAMKLLKADFLGTSDPYVKLNLTGEKLPAKKTTIKKNNLNPEWNENFKLIVKDPQSQVLQLQVFDWDKVGGHDRLGMQLVPLNVLTPHDTKEFTLDLLKHSNITDPRDKKQRGQIVVELTFVPFKEDSAKFNEPLHGGSENSSEDERLSGAGLLSVMVQGAEDVEGEHHNNPYASVLFRGEKKKTKVIRKTRDPRWNEEFQFTLDQPPLHEKIRIDVMSKRKRFSFQAKESLGHVEINLDDVVHNGRINEKYHLIDSKNGVIHVEIRWDTV
ncbi:synaptotagmin-3 isoform X2 [Hevea brasiliensis]|uniref:synaptotagmin-3 isoform X2 n=2 Tax=Hevea brasiliensis TaxID=3981 RepID=UPI0025E5A371|nr:synaptotagmin-3 isoform X2 [Hevea brasiliensis]